MFSNPSVKRGNETRAEQSNTRDVAMNADANGYTAVPERKSIPMFKNYHQQVQEESMPTKITLKPVLPMRLEMIQAAIIQLNHIDYLCKRRTMLTKFKGLFSVSMQMAVMTLT